MRVEVPIKFEERKEEMVRIRLVNEHVLVERRAEGLFWLVTEQTGVEPVSWIELGSWMVI